ncbi:hypothetical protein BT96DRAFT_951580, partial [Gymnopus androsaceus JB14]
MHLGSEHSPPVQAPLVLEYLDPSTNAFTHPVRPLGMDLLSLIFEFLCLDYLNGYIPPQLTVIHVCHNWRVIALHYTPKIWSIMSFSLPRKVARERDPNEKGAHERRRGSALPSSSQVTQERSFWEISREHHRIVSDWFSRSGNFPLTIHFMNYTEKPKEEVEEFFRPFIPHLKKCRELRLLLYLQFPERMEQVPSSFTIRNFRHASQLKHLRIHTSALSFRAYIDLPLSQLTTLSIKGPVWSLCGHLQTITACESLLHCHIDLPNWPQNSTSETIQHPT